MVAPCTHTHTLLHMDMEKQNNEWLLQPLIPPTTSNSATSTQSPTTTQYKVVSNNSSSALRLLFVFFIGLISIWANHEASRFFDITIVNEFGHTPSGKLFNLGYVSNGKASDMILEAAQSIGRRLFPENHDTLMQKLISTVSLRAVNDNLTDTVVATDFGNREFCIKISLSVLEAKDAKMAMESALRRGMARVWLWDVTIKSSEFASMTSLIEGIIEYVSVPPSLVGAVEQYSTIGLKLKEYNSSGRVVLVDKDPRVVAHLLSRCEKKNKGFVEQLVGRIAKDRWREGEELLERCNDSTKNYVNLST